MPAGRGRSSTIKLVTVNRNGGWVGGPYPCDCRKPRPPTENGDWDDEEKDSENPEAHDDGYEQAMADVVVAHDAQSGIYGDGQHE